jgi:glycerol-3-phosphate dehydrogenase (NAD(P)+)
VAVPHHGPTPQWVRSEATAKDINDHHRNSRYLGNDVILSDTLLATTVFADAANCPDVIVMGVPSHGFRGVPTDLGKELRPRVPVVSLVKGSSRAPTCGCRRSSKSCCLAIRQAS